VTAVFADGLDRESIFQALKNRRCYATTGARVFLDFSVNGHPMGADVRMQPEEERVFSMEVMGTSPLRRLELVRNGEVAYRMRPDSDDTNLTATFTDRPTDSAEDCYYMRIMQVDGHQAWSSPVWIA
jgi:hypothetical protein